MAYQQIITGFEGGDFTGLATLGGTISAAALRSGAYGLRCAPTNTAQYGARLGLNDAFAGGTMHASWLQFMVRFNTEPSAAAGKCMVGGIGEDLWMWVEGNGALGPLTHRWGITAAGLGTVTMGILPMIPVVGTTQVWYRIILKVWTYDNVYIDWNTVNNYYGSPHGIGFGTLPVCRFGTAYRYCVAVVCEPSSVPGQWVVLGAPALTGINNFITLGAPALGGLTAVGTSTTWSLDIDDVIFLQASGTDVWTVGKWCDPICGNRLHNYMGSTGFYPPTYGSIFFYDRVGLIPMIAQGDHDEFIPAGQYQRVNEVPRDADAAHQVTGLGAGKTTTYHQEPVLPVYQEIEAYTMRVNAIAAPVGTHALFGVLPGGAPGPPLLQTPYIYTTYTQQPAESGGASETPIVLTAATGSSDENSRYATVVATGYRGKLLSRAVFNNLQMGVRAKLIGSTVTLKNLYIEALLPGVGDYLLPGPGEPFPPPTPPEDTPTPGPGPTDPPPEEPPGFPDPCNRSSCRLPDAVAADSGGGSGCNTDAATAPPSGDCPV